uniref:Leucine rich immune protein (Coil-less) n=1 Tax=Anopheles albimanus TaxID=7167 RepID=A0A182FH64_ANOAL
MLYPDGEVTRMLSRVTSEATYKVYYEKALRIPADCHLELILVFAAPRLQTIKVYGINNVLKRLLVSNIKMRKIPTTIRYLQQLQDLSLENGVLDSFSLKPLKGIRSLTFVNLRSNKLRRLQVCKDPNLIISIERLELAENLLEYIDMEFFTPFKWLKELRLELNQLKQITANKPNNFLTSIDFSLWDMPALHAIDLSRNPLKRLINLSNKFPKLNYLNILRTDIRCLSINGSNISENDLLDVLNTAGNPSTTCPTNSSFPHPFLQGIIIDMWFFTPFKRFRDLDLSNNIFKKIIANKSVALLLLPFNLKFFN